MRYSTRAKELATKQEVGRPLDAALSTLCQSRSGYEIENCQFLLVSGVSQVISVRARGGSE